MIKVVYPVYTIFFTNKDYVVGSVLQALAVTIDYVVAIGINGKETRVGHQEYVVLENYKPEVYCRHTNAEIDFAAARNNAQIFADAMHEKNEQAKPIEPKVGMWVERILHNNNGMVVGEKYKIVSIYSDGDYLVSVGTSKVACLKKWAILLPDYSPVRKWTEAEIQEAKLIVYDLFFANRLKMSIHIGHDGVTYAERNGKHFVAKCHHTNEPNEHIGRMVVLCKAAGRELPAWIKKVDPK